MTQTATGAVRTATSATDGGYVLADLATSDPNADCTGSKTFGTGATHFAFVITPDGKTITWIVTDSGRIMTGTAVRMAGREF